MATISRTAARQKRHLRLRRRVKGNAATPRMAVCTTGKHIYVQFIDDVSGHTLASASTLDPQMRAENVHPNLAGAGIVGKFAAERARSVGIGKVIFDRGGFKYHGRIKALADAARAAGLEF